MSTVWREVARNSGPNGYRAAGADRLATLRTSGPGRPRAGDPALRRYVEDKLAVRWSPQQINRRLLDRLPRDPAMRVSHETIYTSLFVQAEAVLPSVLTTSLRTRRIRRRPQRRMRLKSRAGRIPNMVPHRRSTGGGPRPPNCGHWEGDLLVGRLRPQPPITLVERHSRSLMVLPLLGCVIDQPRRRRGHRDFPAVTAIRCEAR